MKRFFSFLLSASLLASLFSCQKSPVAETEDTTPPDGPTGVISVVIKTPAAETKSATLSDNAIKTVQLFVFTPDGKLETSKYLENYTSSTELKITAKTGDKMLYVVLNGKRLNFTKTSSFENPQDTELNDLSENTKEKLIMVGKNQVKVEPYTSAGSSESKVTVNVKRLTSKIVLKKVTVDFKGTTLENGNFSIQDIYLVNVVGKAPYGVKDGGIPYTLAETSYFSNMANWYSKATYANTAPEMTYDLNYNKICDNVNGGQVDIGLSYLAYPNNSTQVQNGTHDTDITAPVMTGLVLKAHIKSSTFSDTAVDKDTYYTFDLPQLEPNKQYVITNITITMPGADNPGERVASGKITPTITVDPWADGNTNISYDF